MIDPFHYPSPSPKLPSSTSLPVSHSSLLFLQKTENKLAGTGTLGFCRRTMGDALLELEQVLRSSKHKLTDEEVNVLRVCRGKASRDFTITACISSGVVWTVTQRLRYALRINLSAGAAILSGLWRFDRSLDSCLDHILALQGSRMQKELANIILTKYQDNPWRMQLINKHFFPEKVFDDSDVDKPISRWRHRNFFGDNVANNQRAHYTETHSDRTDFEPKQFTVNSAMDVIADPLDYVFGHSEAGEEIHHPDTTGDLPRRHIHGHKRAHRRHRLHQPKESSVSQRTQEQVEC